MACQKQLRKPFHTLVTSAQSTRKLMARYTVGRWGGEFFVGLTLAFLGWHVALAVIGASYNTKCMDIPLLPVVMVLLGGTGILKCLSFLLQLLIVVTVWRKQKDKGAEFMSETSGLDNTMNWTYTVVLLAGDIAAFTRRENTCDRLLYDMAFYTLVVMTTVLGVVFLLDFTVFVYKRCHPPVKEEDEEDEEETDEGEMKQVPQSDITAMIDN
eukprot:XP_011432398.1 PREDICTED: uncharacterized protein LOC105331770 [Crassostrea gigas]